MSAKRDYYEVLGINKNASPDDIKKAYRKLAMEYHPDRNPGDKVAEDKFKEAAEAYAVLSDTEKKGMYDQFGHSMGGRGFQGFQGFEENFGSFGDVFGDIFSEFFGGESRTSGGGRRGSDLEMQMEVTLEEAFSGKETSIEIPRKETCDECKGSGAAPGSKKTTCTDCGGRGEVRVTQGFFTMRRTCSKCRGEGHKVDKPCAACRGEGRVQRKRKLSVKVPQGIDSGTRLKVTGEGEAGQKGGGRGDLYVHIHVTQHAIFERRDHDLSCDLAIPYTVAALGGEVKVPTIEGDSEIKVAAGTPSGKVFVLKESGMPYLQNPRRRGDQYVRIEIEVPSKLSNEEKKLLEQFASLRKEKAHPKKKGFFDQVKETFE